jgi:hypothetical protein
MAMTVSHRGHGVRSLANHAGPFRQRLPRPRQLQCSGVAATINAVQNPIHEASSVDSQGNPFQRGAMVIVTLGNPREKIWGVVLGLSQEGLSVGGVELSSFDDLVRLVKDGELPSSSVVFFPMHRIERVELDLPDGSLDSLSQRFRNRTGVDAAPLLSRHEESAKESR